MSTHIKVSPLRAADPSAQLAAWRTTGGRSGCIPLGQLTAVGTAKSVAQLGHMASPKMYGILAETSGRPCACASASMRAPTASPWGSAGRTGVAGTEASLKLASGLRPIQIEEQELTPTPTTHYRGEQDHALSAMPMGGSRLSRQSELPLGSSTAKSKEGASVASGRRDTARASARQRTHAQATLCEAASLRRGRRPPLPGPGPVRGSAASPAGSPIG